MQSQINLDADPRLQVMAQFLSSTGFSAELAELNDALGNEPGQFAVGALYRLADAMDEYFEDPAGDIHLVQCLGMKTTLGDIRADVHTFDTIEGLHYGLDLLILAHILRSMLEEDLGIRTVENLFQLRSFAIDTFVNMIRHIKDQEADRDEITPEMEFVRLMLNTKDAIIDAIENTTMVS